MSEPREIRPQDGVRKSSGPWVVLAIAALLVTGAWTTLFIIAHHHPVEEVPLATSPGTVH